MRALPLLALLALIQQTSCLYFYLQKGMTKCFKDELVKSTEIQAHVTILDQVVDEHLKKNKDQSAIVYELTTPAGEYIKAKVLPDEIYRYNTTLNGEFKLCISISDDVFDLENVKEIKTQLKFSNEYYKLDKEDKKSKKQEVDLRGVATEGNFAPLKKRTNKISKIIDDIIAHQNWEREKEQQYKDKLTTLSGSFFNLVMLQLLAVVASAAYSVIALRKFFVKKHIY